jgi:hypothetical protein
MLPLHMTSNMLKGQDVRQSRTARACDVMHTAAADSMVTGAFEERALHMRE